MTPRDAELAARRAELLDRSSRLRADIAERTRDITGRFSGVERLATAARSNRPLMLAGAAALMLFAGPRRAVRLAGRALMVLGVVKRLLRLTGSSRP
jgi:hypothetical protein